MAYANSSLSFHIDEHLHNNQQTLEQFTTK